MPMDRRQFLRLTTLAAAVGLLPGGCSAAAPEDDAALSHPALLGTLGPGVVRQIGAQYQRLIPAEVGARALQSAIRASLPWSARLPWSHRVDVPALVREDFARGRTIEVQGWILSATEARQCALFSLLPT
jgi:hypothetical protein